MRVEPIHDLPQSVQSERKIMDSNPTRETFLHANTVVLSHANNGAAQNKKKYMKMVTSTLCDDT